MGRMDQSLRQPGADSLKRFLTNAVVMRSLGQRCERNGSLVGLAFWLYVPSSQVLARRSCPDANKERSFWNSLPASATVFCT